MRICFLITNSWPLIGGLEKVCLRVAQGFRKQGNEVKIICRFTESKHTLKEYFSSSEPSRSFNNESIQTTILGVNYIQKILLKPVFKLIWRKSTFEIARRIYLIVFRSALRHAFGNVNVIHYFGSGPEMLGFAAAEVAKEIGAFFVVEPALHKGQWGDSWIDSKLYKKADLVIAHTHYEKTVLGLLGINTQRITVITHGVDLVGEGDGNRFKLKYGITEDIVLFLGRKTKQKGVSRLINAWPNVISKHPNTKLVKLGPRIEKYEYTHSSIIDIENISDSEKEDALAACEVLCVPSEGESFGMVYFEAWGYKKPVIGLNIPVLRETIGRSGGGILVNDDPDALAAAMNALLSDPKRCASMGEAGKLFSINHHWNKAIESYSDAYEMRLGTPKQYYPG